MITAIIQARMGSTRLPGKVILDLKGKPVLWHVVNRVSQAKKIDTIVVATTLNEEDNRIADFCRKEHIQVFRGSAEDVLERYYNTANSIIEKEGSLDFIVRITADCPLIDPEIIDIVAEAMINGDYDYISNVIPPTYPDGLDVEIFRFSALKDAYEHARLDSEREHVTPYIINTKSFKIFNVQNKRNLSGMRWTLDEPEDYQFVLEVYNRLYDRNPHFHMQDVLDLISEYPKLEKINIKYLRNEGYKRSLQQDKIREHRS